ncbi:MAG: hypothetical protein IKQ46_00730 [Bacteroidales bacterium]|nr:hypothetical protein [Bacteroidales bacterium]
MKKYTDTDIRTALKNIEQKRQPVEVPDDFLDNVLDAIEQDEKPKTVKLWRYVAVAAGIALIVCIGAAVFFHNDNGGNVSEQTVASVTVEDTAANFAVEIPQQTVAEVVDTPKIEPSKPEKNKPSVKKTKPQKQPKVKEQQTVVAENKLSEPEKKYIAPSKMDEAIMKMADFQHAEKQVFECNTDENDTKEILYVFDENDDFDLMGNLILSACHFDQTTSGYFLNYSQQKFFFSINDEKNGRNYTWIADCLSNGKTILYCANAPQGINSTSDCYISYINKMSLKNMNTYTNI